MRGRPGSPSKPAAPTAADPHAVTAASSSCRDGRADGSAAGEADAGAELVPGRGSGCAVVGALPWDKVTGCGDRQGPADLDQARVAEVRAPGLADAAGRLDDLRVSVRVPEFPEGDLRKRRSGTPNRAW